MKAFLFTIFINLLVCFGCKASNVNANPPYFASLRAKRTHLHVGPGHDYPIEWVYTKSFFPVQVMAIFDKWRQIKDPFGTTGWVHKSLLSSKRFVLIINKKQFMHKNADSNSKVIAIVSPGVIAKYFECKDEYCYVEVISQDKKYKGWILKKGVWGL